MSEIYDNWERLTEAVLHREELRQLCYASSRSPSVSSKSSSFSPSTFLSCQELNRAKFPNSDVNLAHEPERIGQQAPREHLRNIAPGGGSRDAIVDQITRMQEELRQLSVDLSRSLNIPSESSSFGGSNFFSLNSKFTNSEVTTGTSTAQNTSAAAAELRQLSRYLSRSPSISSELSSFSSSSYLSCDEEFDDTIFTDSDIPRTANLVHEPERTGQHAPIPRFDPDQKSAYKSDVKRTANQVEPEGIEQYAGASDEFVTYRSQKVVWQLDVNDDKSKQQVLKRVSSCHGVEYVAFDMNDKTLTVIGRIDPVAITESLRKLFNTYIVSIEPTKEPLPKSKPELEVSENKQPEKGDDEKIPDLTKIYQTYNPSHFQQQHQSHQQFQSQVTPNLYYYQQQNQSYQQIQGQVTPNLYNNQHQYQSYQQLQRQVTPNLYNIQYQNQSYQQLQRQVAPNLYNNQHQYQSYQLYQGQVAPNLQNYQHQYQCYQQFQGQVGSNFYYYQYQYQSYQLQG